MIENNLINLHPSKKINNSNYNFRKTTDNIFTENKNIILIKVVSNSNTQTEIKYINNFCSNDILIYVNGASYKRKNTVEMNYGETFNIKLHYPNNFYGSCDKMFFKIYNVIEIKFKNFTGCNSARNMFSHCHSLKNLDLSSFDTSKITTMFRMFYHCYSLEFLDVTSFKTNSLQNLHGTFSNCSKLTFLNLSSFNTNLVDNMDNIFENSLNLHLVILSNKFTMNNLKYHNYINNINECMMIIENGASLTKTLKDHLQTCCINFLLKGQEIV